MDFNALRKDLAIWERGEQSVPREWLTAYVNLQNATPQLARLAFLVPKMADLLHSQIEEEAAWQTQWDLDAKDVLAKVDKILEELK
ncbi:MAG: hypothetical protein KGL63_01745 [Betaproteobacteria bacterium]|nr:hypothetical protein [Betaproteobacteria bacterium]